MKLLLTSALLGLAWPGPVPRHAGLPIWTELGIEEDAVVFSFSGEPEALLECLDIDLQLVGPMSEEEEAKARDAFAAFLAEEATIAIDGEPVRAVLTDFELPEELDALDVGVVVHAYCRFETDEPARRVDLSWQRYDGAEWNGEVGVPLTVRNGRRAQMFVLDPNEPGHSWHRPLEGSGPPARLLVAPVAAEGSSPVRVPMLSLALAGVGVALFALLVRREARPATRLVLVSGALLAAAGVREVGVVEFGGEVVGLPSRDQAEAIFESLHGNIYAAFDADTEGAIYDLLAVSVSGPVLEEVYRDVYESLILREEGGAVCDIESVEVVARDVDVPSEGEPRFDVEWSWQAHGLVSHWGHLHRRTNEYRAKYHVAYDGAGWKIAAFDVLEYRRLDPDAPDATEGFNRFTRRTSLKLPGEETPPR